MNREEQIISTRKSWKERGILLVYTSFTLFSLILPNIQWNKCNGTNTPFYYDNTNKLKGTSNSWCQFNLTFFIFAVIYMISNAICFLFRLAVYFLEREHMDKVILHSLCWNMFSFVLGLITICESIYQLVGLSSSDLDLALCSIYILGFLYIHILDLGQNMSRIRQINNNITNTNRGAGEVIYVSPSVSPSSSLINLFYFNQNEKENFLSTYTFIPVKGISCEKKTCSICLQEEEEEEEQEQERDSSFIIIAQCGHPFHKVCILEWWKTNLNCPLCRVLIRPQEKKEEEKEKENSFIEVGIL